MKRYDTKQLRILAIDDEQVMLDHYRDALALLNTAGESEYDFDVVLCKQGDEAVNVVKKAVDKGYPFAVAFLDLHLPPGPDGIWAGEQIRRLDPNINFVIVTGLLNVNPREISRRIPPEDKILYVQKPFHLQELRQFAAALGAKWKSEMMLQKAKEELEKKVGELERSRKELLAHRSELENVNNQLMETNNALSVLAKNLDRTRKESEKRVVQRTKTLIMPIMERLRRGKGLERYRTDLELLVDYIKNLTDDLADDVKIAATLSATELRVASLIRNGMSNNEMAEHLCVSPATVKTHRRNIRKKLNLRKSGINLKVYLKTEMG
ncbi:MAG: response regulator [Deltaproteobacteria bacterium]|nr:response regulator [Deltaproteobacteria bacterium]